VRVQQIYEANKDKGLQVLWVMSETKQKEQLPSWSWLTNYVETKGLTMPVVRDFKFAQTYAAMKHASTALPHQYILDGSNMELLMALGGKKQEAEDLIQDKLGVFQLLP